MSVLLAYIQDRAAQLIKNMGHDPIGWWAWTTIRSSDFTFINAYRVGPGSDCIQMIQAIEMHRLSHSHHKYAKNQWKAFDYNIPGLEDKCCTFAPPLGRDGVAIVTVIYVIFYLGTILVAVNAIAMLLAVWISSWRNYDNDFSTQEFKETMKSFDNTNSSTIFFFEDNSQHFTFSKNLNTRNMNLLDTRGWKWAKKTKVDSSHKFKC